MFSQGQKLGDVPVDALTVEQLIKSAGGRIPDVFAALQPGHQPDITLGIAFFAEARASSPSSNTERSELANCAIGSGPK